MKTAKAPTATQTQKIKDRNPEGVEANASGDRPRRHISSLRQPGDMEPLSKGESAHTPELPKHWTACFPRRNGKRTMFPHVHIGPKTQFDKHCSGYITINEAGTANLGGLESFDAIATLIAAAPETAAERDKLRTWLDSTSQLLEQRTKETEQLREQVRELQSELREARASIKRMNS